MNEPTVWLLPVHSENAQWDRIFSSRDRLTPTILEFIVSMYY